MKKIRIKVDGLLKEYQHLIQIVREEKRILKNLQMDVKYSESAQSIIQEVAKGVQQQVHSKIAVIVTKALEAIFDEPYEFRILFDRKRGKTEAKLVFMKGNYKINPTSAAGGGVLEVAAFALRMASLVITRPARRRVLVLDEPFKNVNGEVYQSRMGAMISDLSKKLDVQIIMVSDDEWLKIGKIVNL